MKPLKPFAYAAAASLTSLLLTPQLALAATDAGEKTPLNLKDSTGPNTHVGGGGSIVRTIVGLAVVIGVIYGLTWVLKQLKASKGESAAGTGLETLGTLPLGVNHALHLVRAGDEIVLVGTGEQGVTPIRTYTEAEARALGLLQEPLGDMALADPEVFGTDTRRGRFIDELRKRTVIK
jgi:flagellar protein FliO/FliZ